MCYYELIFKDVFLMNVTFQQGSIGRESEKTIIWGKSIPSRRKNSAKHPRYLAFVTHCREGYRGN